MNKVVVVTVTYGDRWKFLSQVIGSVISENNLEKIIIVDNASINKIEIDHCVEKNKDKIILLRNEKNEGSAGGFARGISCARNLDCDYVLLLDDDNVAENAISKFLETIEQYDDKTILCGNRSSLNDVQDMFVNPEKYKKHKNTFFEIFSFGKIKNLLSILSSKKDEKREIQKIVETSSFAYGGAFLPKQAIIDAPLPDVKLWTYGDDIAYSWGAIKQGYKCFACFDIHIKDVDFTFSEINKNSHLIDLLLPQVSDFKVYYRMRNAVRISREYSKQWGVTLLLSIIIWYIGLLIIFIIKQKRFGIFQIKRAKLIATAFYRGCIGDMRLFEECNK